MIRSRSTGILHISPTVAHRFSADDLEDMGEIGHGSFGTVNKMKHRQTGTVMAVKVSIFWKPDGSVMHILSFFFCSAFVARWTPVS